MTSDEYLELLNTYSDIILPSVYGNAQSYYEVLGRIRYVLEKLEADNIIDYTENFETVIDNIATNGSALISQISSLESTVTSNTNEEKPKITAEETARKETDASLESQIATATKGLSNLAIKRSFVLICENASILNNIRNSMEIMGASISAVLMADLPSASNALEETTIKDKAEVTDIVYIGSTSSVATVKTDINNLMEERSSTYPSAIVEIMPYFNIYTTGSIYNAMKEGCQQGAIFLGGTASSYAYNSHSNSVSPWIAAIELINGRVKYDLISYILTDFRRGTDYNDYYGVKADITETGVFLDSCTMDNNYNVTNSQIYKSSGTGTITGCTTPLDLPTFYLYERSQLPNTYSSCTATIDLTAKTISISNEGSNVYNIAIRGKGFIKEAD